MKNILILLLFIPHLLFSQVGIDAVRVNKDFRVAGSIGTGNGISGSSGYAIPVPVGDLGFYWDGGINPIDSTLLNRVTGKYDSNVKLYSFDGSLDNSYLSCKSSTLIKIFGDTIPVVCLFQNYNYADTLYFKKEEHTINADSTENLPKRITEIAYYSEKVSDSDSSTLKTYFDVPNYPLAPKTVGADKTYATIALAVAAATAGDTIIISSGTYDEGVSINSKSLVILGTGNVRWYRTSGRCVTNTSGSADNPVIFRNIDFKSVNNDIIFRTASGNPSYYEVSNCKITTTNTCFNETSNSVSPTIINNCVLNKGISWKTSSLTLNDCYIQDAVAGIGGWNSIDFEYCKATMSSTFLVNLTYANWIMKMNGCNFTGYVITDAVTAYIGIFNLRNSTITNSATRKVPIDFASYTGDISITYHNVTFNDVNSSHANYLRLDINGNQTFSKCTFNNLNGVIEAYARGRDTITFDSCTFISDYITRVNIKDFVFNFTYNYIESDTVINIQIKGENQDTIPAYIANNTFIDHTPSDIPMVSIGAQGSQYTGRCRGSIVEKNKFIGTLNYGGIPSGTHALFIYGDETTIRYNYFNGMFLGLVVKNDGNDLDSTEAYYNVFEDVRGAIIPRGVRKSKYYNNTIVWRTDTVGAAINILSDPDTPGSYSDSTVFKNNLIVDLTTTGQGYLAIIEDTNSLIGTDIDTNLYYRTSGNYFSYDGVTRTINYWQTNIETTLINSNPNLGSGLWPVAPSDAIDNGENLGESYNTGLDIATNWSLTPPTIVTDTQGASWTIGAYIIK